MSSAVLADAISAQKRFTRGEEQLRGRNKRRRHKIRSQKEAASGGEEDASGKWGVGMWRETALRASPTLGIWTRSPCEAAGRTPGDSRLITLSKITQV